MDSLQDAANNNEVMKAITIGGIYGIFLVFGQSWAEFLKIAILSIAPSHDDEVVASLLYALSASFICLLLLFGIVKFNSCMNTSTKQLQEFTKQVRKKSRADISNAL